jgi:pyruvate formate lyase activating enzyme
MIIAGLQKLSLLDYPEHICSVVFTYGCNFRCRFCHNPELVIGKKPSTIIPEKTVLEHLKNNRDVLDGVCITGGEPTLHRDLDGFIAAVKGLKLKVKLDSNGSNPLMLKMLIDSGDLDYIAMDLKQTWEKYPRITQVDSPLLLKNIKESFRLIQESGIDHEFRTTLMPEVHSEKDLKEMASYLKAGEKYYLQDIRYQVTLEPGLKPIPSDATGLTEMLSKRFPQLEVTARTSLS